MIAGLDSSGSEWLSQLLRRRGDISMLSPLAIFGGLSYTPRRPRALLELQVSSAGRIRFRLLPMDSDGGAPGTCLVATSAAHKGPVAIVGPTFNFGMERADRTQSISYFQWKPCCSKASASGSTGGMHTARRPPQRQIFRLWCRLPGLPEAAALWEDYCLRCAAVGGAASEDVQRCRCSIRIPEK